MHVLFVVAHPEPSSFNWALTRAAIARLEAEGHTTEVSDLYGEGFDPVEKAAHFARRHDESRFEPTVEQRHAVETGTIPPEVAREIARVDRADLLVVQFPLWWHGAPAILKGWFDRVFIAGLTYTSQERYDRGRYRGRRAILSMTAGAPADVMDPGGRGGDTELMLWPLNFSLMYLGYSVMAPFVACGVAGAGYYYETEEQKTARLAGVLADWPARLAAIEAEAALPFYGWDDWDAQGRLRPDVPFSERRGLRYLPQT